MNASRIRSDAELAKFHPDAYIEDARVFEARSLEDAAFRDARAAEICGDEKSYIASLWEIHKGYQMLVTELEDRAEKARGERNRGKTGYKS